MRWTGSSSRRCRPPATRRAGPRAPFPDEVARALANATNLAPVLGGLLSRRLQPARCLGDDRYNRPPPQRVLKGRWDCLGRYGGRAMLWHDLTKVGNYDTAIRILESL